MILWCFVWQNCLIWLAVNFANVIGFIVNCFHFKWFRWQISILLLLLLLDVILYIVKCVHSDWLLRETSIIGLADFAVRHACHKQRFFAERLNWSMAVSWNLSDIIRFHLSMNYLKKYNLILRLKFKYKSKSQS